MFITFEGIDGAGKSSQAKRLADWFAGNGIDVLLTRAPGGTNLGQTLRELIMSNPEMSPSAELLLFLADRAELISRVIAPALIAGKVVICDRFDDSTRVYQGMAWGAIIDELAELVPGSTRDSNGNVRLYEQLVPDLTFVLDLDPGIASERTKARGQGPTRYEKLGIPFFTAARDYYRFLARRYHGRITVIDATPDADTVALKTKTRVMAVMAAGTEKPV